MVFDFGALPPEINSGKIYSGPGSAPLLAAATAWDALASELQTTAASYASTIGELTTSWQGPSSAAASDAAAPYTAWLSNTAAQAEQTASQAQAAAGAYEAAFAASIPPPVIAANRAALALLVATNFLGQNTPAIAANEATYAEFWAQDAVAMYGYAGTATTASQLTPFTAAPATTNDTGQATQSASTAQSAAASSADATTSIEAFLTELNTDFTNFGTELSTLSTQLFADFPTSTTTLASLLTSLGLPTSVTNAVTLFNQGLTTGANTISTYASGPWSIIGIGSLMKNWYQMSISIPSLGTGIQGIGPLLNPKPIIGALSPLLHSGLLSGSYGGAGNVGALASAGRAGTIGALSVPQNWASAVPAVRTVAAEMDATALDAAPEMASIAQPGMFGQTALSSLAGRAIGGSATRAVAGQGYRVPGAVATDDIATTATIIVIPPSAE
ncbi:PPE family protein, SVP subgroup [Mycobacterium sp.]|uniref:PPE family protein, SVP subgroup n=1 Tax=Mycobacterium sp. TaxID=1785 RepID=UPI003C73663A